jgi:hypothetical protein
MCPDKTVTHVPGLDQQPTLGVLFVGPHHVVRRCRSCQGKAFQDLPLLNKEIIYVDQFAISNMLKAQDGTRRADKHTNFWRQLFVLLDRLVRLQLVACPYSSIHVYEAMVAPQLEEGLLKILRRLSAGMSFIDRFEFEAHQLVNSATAWLAGTPVAASLLAARTALQGDPTAWEAKVSFTMKLKFSQTEIDMVRSVRDETATDMGPVFQRWQAEKMDFDARFREEAMALGRRLGASLMRRVSREDDIKAGRAQAAEGAMWLSPDRHPLTLIFWAFMRSGLDQKAATQKVHEFMTSDALLDVPWNRIRSMLWASFAREAQGGRKQPIDRGAANDIAAISTVLPYCDAMLVDNKSAEHLATGPLAQEVARYNCKVFSLQRCDALLDYLERVEAESPVGHVALAKEVYGDPMSDPAQDMLDDQRGESAR